MKHEKATFALGCFWAPDDYFSKLDGVVSTTAGYTGGTKPDPTYHALGDHTEAVEIEFNPGVLSYQELLQHFWRLHNPTLRQKTQYRSAIFTHNDRQYELAQASKQQQSPNARTAIEPAGTFTKAEEYHQKYYQKQGVSV